jgi:DNA-binding response OmpR family regulator
MTNHVLIVEDEATLRETLAYNLAKESYQVTQSDDGAKA